MTRWRDRGRWTLAVAGLAGVVGACGGASHAAAPAAPPGGNGAASPAGGPAAAAPQAVESNPGGDIPDSQAFVAYRDPGGRFTVSVPEGWARSAVGAAALFTDKYNSIRVETRTAATAPSVASARSVDLPALQTATAGFAPGTVTTVGRRSGPVVLVTYRATSAPNSVTGKVATEAFERYEFWRSGRQVVVTVAAPVGSDNVDPWRKVTDSFAWTP